MMHFKNNAGFTLIEIMAAIMVIALVLTPLFVLQGTVLQQVMRVSKTIERILSAKQFLISTARDHTNDREFRLEKKHGDATMIFTHEPIKKESTLSKVRGLVQEQVAIEWSERRELKKDMLVTFKYIPEKSSS